MQRPNNANTHTDIHILSAINRGGLDDWNPRGAFGL